MGATWSLGIISEVTEYNVHTRLSAAAGTAAGRLPRGRKYTVAFDDGSSEAGIPLDRIRRDNSPAPARPEGRAGDAAAPEAAVAAEAAAVVSPEAVEGKTG